MDQPPLPPLEDVDSLIARNAPIARTRKRRSENFERCTTATTTGQYLAMGAARKDLKYDIEQGFVMVLDRAPPLAGHLLRWRRVYGAAGCAHLRAADSA